METKTLQTIEEVRAVYEELKQEDTNIKNNRYASDQDRENRERKVEKLANDVKGILDTSADVSLNSRFNTLYETILNNNDFRRSYVRANALFVTLGRVFHGHTVGKD